MDINFGRQDWYESKADTNYNDNRKCYDNLYTCLHISTAYYYNAKTNYWQVNFPDFREIFCLKAGRNAWFPPGAAYLSTLNAALFRAHAGPRVAPGGLVNSDGWYWASVIRCGRSWDYAVNSCQRSRMAAHWSRCWGKTRGRRMQRAPVSRIRAATRRT